MAKIFLKLMATNHIPNKPRQLRTQQNGIFKAEGEKIPKLST